ncbi:MAG TPA: tRNA glutamyl-Q(34) synthetase GluQRS [Methylocystis sp.]|nr:tRNA glutamyl-Q(34) synthetase GluQRS [Methylocystis sp.]
MNLPHASRTFRFAPSPNGLLHLGHAYSALLNFELARKCGGRFLLRIEDIDLSRARLQFEAAIYEDLAWLGLDWERPVRRQSEHFDDYRRALKRLYALGLLYPCDCARRDIAQRVGKDGPRDPDGAPLYPGTCRDKPRPAFEEALRPGFALRLDMERARTGSKLCWEEAELGGVEARPEEWGDVVLARKDTPASYHLAVVVDDALQGVTDVVRGKDLFPSTSAHRLLQELLGLPAPRFRHHKLLLDSGGEKLAKIRGSKSLRDLRETGVTPQVARRLAGFPG